MLKNLNWSLWTSSNRNTTNESLKDIISNNEGAIMNSNIFSDLVMTPTVEIEENRIHNLHTELSLLSSILELGYGDFSSTPKKEWLIFMNISFAQGTGTPKQDILEVPG